MRGLRILKRMEAQRMARWHQWELEEEERLDRMEHDGSGFWYNGRRA